MVEKNEKPKDLEQSPDSDKKSASGRKGFFQARDGTSIYYSVQGTGPTLVLCYGLVCRMGHWHNQLDHFRDKYQIVMFDYRGHHRSAVPENDQHMTLQWSAWDLMDLLTHLKIEKAVCLGHSLGATAAVELIISIMAINKSIIPPTINLDNPDEQCDPKLNFVPLQAQEKDVNVAISNSLGFGGHNSCLVVGKVA